MFPLGPGDEAKACQTCAISLFHTDPEVDKENLADDQGQRVNGTCDWISTNELYQTWLRKESSTLLWLHGPPGVGKTMIARYLTDEMGAEFCQGTGKKAAVLYYFCDYQDTRRNTEAAVLCGLLYLLLKRQPGLIKHLLRDFELYSQSSGLFSTQNRGVLWKNFELVLSTVEESRVFCILDGLDEIGNVPCNWLLKRINQLTERRDFKPVTKFIVTSTDFNPIPRELSGVAGINLDPKYNPKVREDVDQFITVKVDELASHGGYSDDLKETLKNGLIRGANGTFLWVAFIIPELMETPNDEVEFTLEHFPRRLNEIFMRMLEIKVPENERALVAGILHWVAVAVRPLTLRELATATNATENQLQELIRSTGGFLRLSKSEGLFSRETVRFIHSSAKSSLMDTENTSVREFHIEPKQVNLHIATRCFEYIQSGPLKDSYINLRDKDLYSVSSIQLHEYPLLDYASRYWPEHACLSSSEITAMFKNYPNFCGKRSNIRDNWLKTYWSDPPVEWNTPRNFELIHLAAFFGIVPLLEYLTCRKFLPFELPRRIANRRSDHNMTALHWASRNGRTEAVKHLLRKGASISVKGYGMTPLTWAIRNGHLETVEVLLANGASVEQRDYGMTSLNWAAWEGNEAICRALIYRWAEVDAQTSDGNSSWLVDAKSNSGEFPWRSSIEAAVFSRQSKWTEERWFARDQAIPDLTFSLLVLALVFNIQVLSYVGSLILPRMRNTAWLNGRQGNIGGQQVCWAAVTFAGRAYLLIDLIKDWHYNILKFVQTLRDIPYHVFGSLCSSLCLILLAKYQGLSKFSLGFLLSSIVVVDVPVYSVLFLANCLEFYQFVPYIGLLICTGDLPSKHRSICRVLSRLGVIVLCLCHWYGFAFAVNYYPYTCITFSIFHDLFKLVWGIIGDQSDGYTSLYLAASRGHNGVAKLLLRSGADIDSKDDAGRTALQIAMANGNISVERVILEHEVQKISPRRVPGSTVLQLAVALGRLDLAQDLLAKGCDPNESDMEGYTALHSVAYFGRTTMIEPLFQNTTPPMNRANNYGETPLHLACLGCRLSTVNHFLEHGADPSILTEYGLSPLHYAIVGGSLSVSTKLASIPSLATLCGVRGVTPLHVAIHRQKGDILASLLSSGADPTQVDQFGRSPFDYAVNTPSLRSNMGGADAYPRTPTSIRSDTLHNTVRRLAEELLRTPLEFTRLADLGLALLQLGRPGHAQTAYYYIFADTGSFQTVCDGCLTLIGGDMYVCHDCWDRDLCDICFNLYDGGRISLPGCQNHRYLQVQVAPALHSADLRPNQIREAQIRWIEDIMREEGNNFIT